MGSVIDAYQILNAFFCGGYLIGQRRHQVVFAFQAFLGRGRFPGTDWPFSSLHFIQLMWQASVGLGCAQTVGCTNLNIIVCNYTPPGNYSNVLAFS